MDHSGFIDYYELLQISPKAEAETIDRVFKMLASRYHPDNQHTGDLDRFVLLSRAHEILSDASQRESYDLQYKQQYANPIEIFETKDFTIGIDGEINRRMGLLCLLYNRRRSNPEHPGLSLLEFESMMSLPREHLMFTIWYLRDRDYVRQAEASDYVITGGGVDYVESHLPSHQPLYKLLKSAEVGGTHTRAGPEAE